jgi:hypothetical protein
MRKFAANTRVCIERSRAEIERFVIKYGATRLATAYEGDRCMMAFEFQGHRVRFVLPSPDRNKYKRPDVYAKEHRRLWRAFALIIKAQLEGVVSGVFAFEDVFLAHLVEPKSNRTYGELHAMQIGADRQLKAASDA